MTQRILAGLVIGAWLGLGLNAALGDEARGVITDLSYGTFKLDEKGAARQFYLHSRKTQYVPTTWRPTVQDSVTVSFTPTQSKKGTTLTVDKVTLDKAGPETIVSVDSPVTVEITEVSAWAIKAKLPSGQVVKFSYSKSIPRIPANWTPAAGDKARVESRPEPTMVFTVSYVINKIEKLP